jgi:hypothetical protein
MCPEDEELTTWGDLLTQISFLLNEAKRVTNIHIRLQNSHQKHCPLDGRQTGLSGRMVNVYHACGRSSQIVVHPKNYLATGNKKKEGEKEPFLCQLCPLIFLLLIS